MRIVFRQLSLCALLLFLFPAAAEAQAPVVTPAGDPSIRNDSIYALAVDSAKHGGEPYVLLLDDGIVRYEADGRGTRTYRQVTQILTQSAVEQFAEHAFSYAPGHQRLTVNWIRVVRPDGTVVSDTPPHVQDADVPATLGDPVYTDEKVRRYSLSSVAPGTIVDWSYTLEELKPQVTGDFLLSWSVHNARLTQWSRYIVDSPGDHASACPGAEPHVRSPNDDRQWPPGDDLGDPVGRGGGARGVRVGLERRLHVDHDHRTDYLGGDRTLVRRTRDRPHLCSRLPSRPSSLPC
jgi:hypothetical protein